jgi:drug/metabolite transporter (DMT)-like permease
MRVDKFYAFMFRVVLFGTAIWFVSLDRNPLVVFQAKIGLSPSPLERIFHVKGMFSGMTEGMYRLAHGDIIGAISANFLTPIFAIVFAVCVLGGYRPRVKTKNQEFVFLLSVVLLSAAVNLVSPLV